MRVHRLAQPHVAAVEGVVRRLMQEGGCCCSRSQHGREAKPMPATDTMPRAVGESEPAWLTRGRGGRARQSGGHSEPGTEASAKPVGGRIEGSGGTPSTLLLPSPSNRPHVYPRAQPCVGPPPPSRFSLPADLSLDTLALFLLPSLAHASSSPAAIQRSPREAREAGVAKAAYEGC